MARPYLEPVPQVTLVASTRSSRSRLFTCLRWFPLLFRMLSGVSGWLRVGWMPGSSQTLRIGDRAPEFTLAAANRSGLYSLPQVLARGPVILEFLRGTW
jgi:hypothetical protein